MTLQRRTATAFAPATVGNVGVGFDLLGHAVVSVGDRVTVTRMDEPTVVIVDGPDTFVPLEPASNTAAAGLLRLIQDFDLPFGFEVALQKGIPLGSGMGGSAASAAGAILAASRLLDEPLSEADLILYGMYGEEVATNSFHPDNLAPCLVGGLVLALDREPLEIVRIPVPANLYCVVVHPRLRLDTRDARKILPDRICLREHVERAGNLAAGTSTGGMTNKRWGRIGDSPIIGAGTFADNATCAVSATGHGEFLIRWAVAYDISALMAYKNMSLAEAADMVVMEKLVKAGGEGGVIAVDRDGNVAMPFNSPGMFRGTIDAAGKVSIAIYKE